MRQAVSGIWGGHLLAAAGVTILHSGIAVWAMAPEPPVDDDMASWASDEEDIPW